jgi:hypothetical protein
MIVGENALQRVGSCCGHALGEHVARFSDPARGTGLSYYCSTCQATCRSSATVTRGMGSPWGALTSFVKVSSGGSSAPRRHGLSDENPEAARGSIRRSPFDALIADLRSDSAAKPRALAPFRRGAFDDLADGLRRDATRMQTQTRSAPRAAADDDVVMVIIDDDGVRRIRRSPLARMADELRAASKPPETFPTREEVRARMKELDRARAERQHQRRLAEIRAAARQVGEFDAIALELDGACRAPMGR